MVEAVVGVALRAILASVVLGGALSLAVLAATRVLALRAATRHALWTAALIATAAMPLAGIAASVVRAAQPAASAAVDQLPGVLTVPAPAANGHGATAPGRSDRLPATTISAATTAAVAPQRSVPLHGRAAGPVAAGWTPRVSHALAVALVAVWALGALIGTLDLAGSVLRVRGLRRRSSPLDAALADELPWLTERGGGREIYLRLSYETETPVAIGFRRPIILIPTELAGADGLTAIEPLVLHEHAHLCRYDDWTNLVQRAVERLFWFNPIVWVVGRRIALEREIAADDVVVEQTGAAKAYAASLWQLAREMRMPEHAVVAPGALLTRKQISVRIEQLLDANRARLHRSPAAALGVATAGLVAVFFVATSAPAIELPPAAPPAVAATWQTVIVQQTDPPAPRPPHAARTAHAAATTQTLPVAKPAHVAELSQRPPHPQPLGTGTGDAIAVPRLPSGLQSVGVQPAARAKVAPLPPLDEVRTAIRSAMAALPREADIPRVIIADARVPTGSRVRLEGTKLSRELLASCLGCTLRGADLRGLDLHGLTINGDDLRNADLRGVDLRGAKLIGVELNGANLADADLRDAELNGVELRGANLDRVRLDGAHLVGISLHGVSLRGTALRGALGGCVGCDLARADLHGQDLHGITLSGADLSASDLHDANLAGVRFSGVDLSRANLAGADLTGASFDGCDLGGADLRGARTAGLQLHGSTLE